jgi:adenylosuccinate synthase
VLCCLKGRWEDISDAKTFEDLLTTTAQACIKTIEEISGAHISAIGVDPRDQTIQIHKLL